MAFRTPPKKVYHDLSCQENLDNGAEECVCKSLRKRNLAILTSTEPVKRVRDSPRFVIDAAVATFKSTNPPRLYAYRMNPFDSYFRNAFHDISEIGWGSFGLVYHAISRDDEKPYAIKRSHHIYYSESRRRRMLHEVYVHEGLPYHKNIVKFFMAWEERDRLFLQLELCGRHSHSYLRVCTPEARRYKIWECLEGYIKAIIHIHENDIIHMDIKPDNMFIGFDGECKLGDFGSAIDLINDNLEDVEDGDSRYIAPEVLNFNPRKASDIFSFAMSILELASQIDFALCTYGEMQRVQERAFKKLDDWQLKLLLRWMLNSDPSKRPTARQVLYVVNLRKYFKPIVATLVMLIMFFMYLIFSFFFG